jgi:predicted Zn-dependent peptidase
MQVLDRKSTPEYKLIDQVKIIQANEIHLDNGIPVHSINAGTQDLIKIELQFNAGIVYQSEALVASSTNSMLTEGTKKHTAAEIADMVDYFGAFLETDCGQDFASVNLYTLNKHLAEVLPYVEEVVKNSVFPDSELSIYLGNKKQKFLVNSKKVDSVARKKFKALIFGEKHHYGYNIKIDDYNEIGREHLQYFHNRYYRSGNCRIIVAGKVGAEAFMLLNRHFGGNDWESPRGAATLDHSTIISEKEKKHIVYKEDAVQSAIRVGKLLFNKTHPDYKAMQVLNTALGGYFGSRLMMNIREDKGYTYGIGSGIVSLQHSGYFFISTEVGVDVCSQALDEIYSELERLRKEPIDDEEMSLVRNYLLGAFLRSVDGPFALAEKFKSIMEYGLGYDYFEQFLHTIRTITPAELQELAKKYLDPNDMIELVVGKKG